MSAGFKQMNELKNLLRVWQAPAAGFRLIVLGHAFAGPWRLPIVMQTSVAGGRKAISARLVPCVLGCANALVAGPRAPAFLAFNPLMLAPKLKKA